MTNVAPTIVLSGAATTNEGSTYSLTLGAVTDPGLDTVTAYIVHWGDVACSDIRIRRRRQTHVYADGPASYTITVDLVDDDGTHLRRRLARRQRPEHRPGVIVSGDVHGRARGHDADLHLHRDRPGRGPPGDHRACGLRRPGPTRRPPTASIAPSPTARTRPRQRDRERRRPIEQPGQRTRTRVDHERRAERADRDDHVRPVHPPGHRERDIHRSGQPTRTPRPSTGAPSGSRPYNRFPAVSSPTAEPCRTAASP